MSSPINTTNITPPRVPLIDERTGLISREWYRFFLNLFTLTGSGTNQTSLVDLQLAPPTPQQEDILDIAIDVEAAKIQPTQESATEQIAELQKQVEALAVMPLTSWALSAITELQAQIDGLLATSIPPVNFLTNGSSILYGDNLGGFSNVTIGSGVSFSGGTLSATGSGGTVTAVTGVAPITSTGGATPAIGVIAAALTKVDDTNVTLTLGGTPASALLAATSLTLGWTGSLAATRGGTGYASYAVGDITYADSTTTLAKLPIGVANAVLTSSGTAPQWSTGVALTSPSSISVNSASDALRVTQVGSGNALVIEDNTNPDATPFVIDTIGKVIAGATSAITGASALVPKIQAVSAAISDSSIGLYGYEGTTPSAAPRLEIGRSKSGTVGTNAAVSPNDTLGILRFVGTDDGSPSTYAVSSQIIGVVDAAVGAISIPGRLTFGTTSPSGTTPTTRLTIDSAGTSTFTGNAVINANTASDAFRITQTGAGNALVVEDSTNPDATPFVVDQSGNVVVGATAPQATYTGGTRQLTVLGAGPGQHLFGFSTTSVVSPNLNFSRTRGAAASDRTVVNSGDWLGIVTFSGADGSALVRGAQILAEVDGTPGANDMPGRLSFSTTADGASTPTERVRIDSAGLTSLQNNAGLQIARTAVTAPAATDGNVFSGTYTPTLTNTTNIAASTAYVCQYMRVGSVVTVSGRVDIDPTVAGRIVLGLSLPIASALTAAEQLGGTFVAAGVTTVNLGSIGADATNDRATFDGVVADVANRSYHFSFTYRVL